MMRETFKVKIILHTKWDNYKQLKTGNAIANRYLYHCIFLKICFGSTNSIIKRNSVMARILVCEWHSTYRALPRVGNVVFIQMLFQLLHFLENSLTDSTYEVRQLKANNANSFTHDNMHDFRYKPFREVSRKYCGSLIAHG